jgi:putative hemolysin
MILKIPILFLLILLNGVFAMSELALIGARRTKLQAASADGDPGAKAALALLHDSGKFLSTVSIGITAIGIVVATIEGDSFVQPLVDEIRTLPVIGPYAHALSIALVVVANTLLTVVFGELVPKRIAIGQPEIIAAKLAGIMTVVSRIVGPAEWLLSGLSSLVLRLLPIPHAGPAPVTDEEITLLMRQGAAAGDFEAAESAIVHMVLRLGDRRIDALMTPRTQIEMLDLEDGWEVNRQKIAESSFSRFPVVEGGPETVVGILQVKDLALAAIEGQGAVDMRALIRPPLYVPNTMPALKLLEMLKKSGAALALVVDEYGDLDGLITQHDLLQALVGDIASQDEDEDRPVVQREDGSWLVAGLTPVDEVKDAVGLRHLPDEESGDFHTLGGFVMARMKRVPKVADHVEVDGWRFEVVDMDGHRVDKVMIVPPNVGGRAADTADLM